MELRRAERKTVVFVTHDVDEAVLLADRIIVFSARPARILADIAVSATLPEKRSLDILDIPEFRKIRRDVLALIRNEEKELEAAEKWGHLILPASASWSRGRAMASAMR
jgi:NitT/TauT family transport system ATP-binding protein